MDDFLIILVAVAALLAMALIALYNHFDRMRFRLERMFYGVREPMGDWVRACAALRGGDDGGYFKLKKLADKTACIRRLVEEAEESSDEKLELQETLLEFCGTFNFMAERYDSRLKTTPSGKIARHLGFRPIGKIDFYPEIKL